MDMTEFAKGYFNFCSRVRLRPSQVIVSSGGALVMLGLRETTSDLDLAIPAETYEFLLYLLGSEKERVTEHGTFLTYSHKVSLQKLPEGITVQTVNGVRLYSIDDLVRQKEALIKSLGRSPCKIRQDHLDIEALKARRREMSKFPAQDPDVLQDQSTIPTRGNVYE